MSVSSQGIFRTSGVIAAAMLGLLSVPGPAVAQTYVLTFDNAGAGQPANLSPLGSSYGSVADIVSVFNQIRREGLFDEPFPGAPGGVSDLFFVFRNGALGASDDQAGVADDESEHMLGEFVFQGLPAGSTVTINSFTFGNRNNNTGSVQWAYYNAADAWLNGGHVGLGADGPSCVTCTATINTPITSLPGESIRLLFQGERLPSKNKLREIVIDNLSFTVTGAEFTHAPEPATMLLLGIGLVALAGVGAARRKKKSL